MIARRYAHALRTVAWQRRQLHRLHREAVARDREIKRLRAILDGHPDQRARILAASPDDTKRLAGLFYDRCEQLTKANATQLCRRCLERTTDGKGAKAS